MLISCCKLGSLPTLIHSSFTTVFIVWGYMRIVLNYVRDILKVPMNTVIIAWDDHGSHCNRAMLNSLYDEYDLFRICIGPRDSPCLMSVEIINR
jgi:hypothetical protein